MKFYTTIFNSGFTFNTVFNGIEKFEKKYPSDKDLTAKDMRELQVSITSFITYMETKSRLYSMRLMNHLLLCKNSLHNCLQNVCTPDEITQLRIQLKIINALVTKNSGFDDDNTESDWYNLYSLTDTLRFLSQNKALDPEAYTLSFVVQSIPEYITLLTDINTQSAISRLKTASKDNLYSVLNEVVDIVYGGLSDVHDKKNEDLLESQKTFPGFDTLHSSQFYDIIVWFVTLQMQN